MLLTTDTTSPAVAASSPAPGLVGKLHQAGLSNAQALQAATIVPACMTGMDARAGSIAPGKTADIILVDGDVSQDITNLRHVRTVFLDGYRLDGASLRQASGLSGMPK